MWPPVGVWLLSDPPFQNFCKLLCMMPLGFGSRLSDGISDLFIIKDCWWRGLLSREFFVSVSWWEKYCVRSKEWWHGYSYLLLSKTGRGGSYRVPKVGTYGVIPMYRWPTIIYDSFDCSAPPPYKSVISMALPNPSDDDTAMRLIFPMGNWGNFSSDDWWAHWLYNIAIIPWGNLCEIYQSIIVIIRLLLLPLLLYGNNNNNKQDLPNWCVPETDETETRIIPSSTRYVVNFKMRESWFMDRDR